MIFLLLLSLFFFDQSDRFKKTVDYDTIEYNIVLGKQKEIRFKQFVFWRDGCSQGYTTPKQEEFIDGPVKSGDYYIVMVKYKGVHYFLRSKTFVRTLTNYDVELQDLKDNEKARKYNVRHW